MQQPMPENMEVDQGSTPAAARGQVLRVAALSKAFHGHLGLGRTVAVHRVDFEVGEGEIFGLLGPNGAGKTTTMKLMLGLLRPDGGEIRLFGAPPSDVDARSRIGYLPENPYFYDYLTAEEFLDFYARLQGIPRAERRDRVRATIERVGLAGKEGIALRKFSKGMTQRVGLAQAIQHEPDLVILDEPMSGLDPIGRREVRDLILSLKEDGKTIFFSSHILQDAEMLCDRVAILRKGRVRSSGSLRSMISGSIRWFEVALRGSPPEMPAAEVVSTTGDETLLRVPDVHALTRLLNLLESDGCQVLSVWPRRESLEDMFLREVASDEEEGEES
ncbi:MAG: ABC transporter ATP-binding protein [bacterium]|nr:ABC transporter ATP-binding protein [bacterium]